MYWQSYTKAPIGPWLLVRRKSPHNGEWIYNTGYFKSEQDIEYGTLRIGSRITVHLLDAMDPQFIDTGRFNDLEVR